MNNKKLLLNNDLSLIFVDKDSKKELAKLTVVNRKLVYTGDPEAGAKVFLEYLKEMYNEQKFSLQDMKNFAEWHSAIQVTDETFEEWEEVNYDKQM